jgi:hypothetical protein
MLQPNGAIYDDMFVATLSNADMYEVVALIEFRDAPQVHVFLAAVCEANLVVKIYSEFALSHAITFAFSAAVGFAISVFQPGPVGIIPFSS